MSDRDPSPEPNPAAATGRGPVPVNTQGHVPDKDQVAAGLFAQSVARPVGLGVAFLTLLVIGIISYVRIPLQLLPSEFAQPGLNIWVPNPGSSARENEEKVARPIEQQLRTLAGIEEVYSSSSDGSVYLSVSFDASLDLDLAKAEVRDRLERARPGMPETVGQIEFWSEDADQLPISWFGILHSGDSDRTDFLLDAVVKPRLEAVPGVSKIDVFGVLNDSMRILLDEGRVIAAGLDIGELIQRLSTDNFAEPLGEIDDGGRRYLLRSDMRFRSAEEIARYPIGNGLVLGDIGRVIRAKSVRDELSRIDGEYAYFGVATKASKADVVEASRQLEAAFEELEADPRLAGQISFLPFFMQGKLIENSLAQLRNTALWGGALALVILMLFLKRIRLTLCVALSIPVSALGAIAWEYFTGGSFNLLTMVGVTLGIGMLVDNSVVMIENVARHRAAGMDGHRAAVIGAREIALAVTLATLTTVVVFMPLIFMASNPEARVIFGGIGLPLCISLLFSLFVAVVFLPVAAARILGPRPAWAERLASRIAPVALVPGYLFGAVVAVARVCGHAAARVLWVCERVVLSVLAPRGRALGSLGWAVRLAGAGALVWMGLEASKRIAPDGDLLEPIGIQPVIPALQPLILGIVGGLGLLLLPPLLARRRRATPILSRPLMPRVGTPLEMITGLQRSVLTWTLTHRTAACALAFACFASIAIPIKNMDMAAFGQDQSSDSVRYWITFDSNYTLAEASEQMLVHEEFMERAKAEIGLAHYSANFDDRGGRMSAFWDETLKPSQRKRNRDWVRENAPKPAGHRVRFADADAAGERSRTIARFELRGPDSRVLEQLGNEAVVLLEQIPGLSNVSAPTDNAPEQLQVEIDRETAYGLGVTSEAAFSSIGWTLRGWPLPRFQDEGREIPFVIEFDEESIAGLSTLRDLSVWTDTGQVPLASFSNIRFEKGSQTIRRTNGRTTLTLSAEVEDPTRTTELNERGYAALASLDLPRGYSLGLDNSAGARSNEEAATMLRALLLSVVLVFLLMGILFESVALPVSVLVTIPFAVMGAFWTLWIVGTPMDLLGWIGLIILAGVVVNNGIVLIDCIHRLRPELHERKAAVLEGAARRVRPILMTALTTIFGLIPMIITEPADDSIDYRALGTVVAGGLFVATFFTLWVVPLAYTLIDDLSGALGRAAAHALVRPTRAPKAPVGAQQSGAL